MLRHVFIVSRDHPWLFAHLQERFGGDPNVEVILDRRVGDRRAGPSTAEPTWDLRRRDRRREIPAADDLRVRSHYIVEL
jgi:hypothetical protein